MKPWTTWLARLGIAGACFLVTGCGGSDVPDASSDGQVAAESAPDAGGGGGAPVAGAASGPKVAQADPAAKTDEAPAETPAATPAPEPETPAAAPKAQPGQGNSSTAEMLAMATGPAGSAPPPAGGATPPADAPTTPAPAAPGGPGAMSRPGGPGGGGPGAMPGGGMGPGGPGGPGGRPGMGGMGGPGQGQAQGQAMAAEHMAKMAAMGQQGRPGGPAAGPAGAGGPGMAGRAGAAPADTGPANLHTPEGAVQAFLNALKAKDLDRLNESTALRAQSEASAKNQELFRNIYELTLSDSQLDELANKLDGYTIAFENPARSTARVEVVLQKAGQNGAYTRRKITVRHEKKGWGVLDIGGPQPFKSMSGAPKRKN